jgi:hypothetical protein
MLTVEELLNEPEIADFRRTHRGAENEIRRATEFLADKPDAVRSIKKLFPAFENKVVSVFFSYKSKEEETARAIVDVLKKKSAGKLDFCYQADFTEKIVGKEWRQWIKQNVRKANWFILLLPDPSDDYDWCLFETGQFEAQFTSADRMICLHHPDSMIPSPIQDYHTVAARIPEMKKFLRMVFVNENPIPGMDPINKEIHDEIPAMAEEIVHAISPLKRNTFRKIYEPWIELKIQNAEELKDKDDLDRAIVLSANQEALDLFDFSENPETLGKLREGLSEENGDGRWRNELLHVVRRIAGGRKFFPIQAVFQADSGKIYRPVLCAIDRLGEKGPIDRFHVTFTEEVSAIDDTAIPRPVAVIATILRFAFRYKWEILERFGKGAFNEEDAMRLDNAIRRINKDWESRGIGGEEVIIELFPKREATKIKEMLSHYHMLRNQEGTGELDIAIQNRNTEKISELLEGLFPINQEFLEMTTIRFTELVSKRHQ